MNSLDIPKNEFKILLDETTNLVLKQFENLDSKKAYQDHSQKEIEKWFDEPLPQEGLSGEELFNFVENKVLNAATGNLGPNMYAYVMAGGNQIGIIADKLASTMNQNVAKWHLSPAMTEIDKRVIQWTANLIGYGNNVGGFIGSSGSSANLDGLTVARNIFFEKWDIKNKGLFGIKPFTLYCSNETHSSIDKSVQLLGIGSEQLREIETNIDFTINLEALESRIKEDINNGYQPFCIIGNAGTVNTGAIDDLLGISKIAAKYNLWFHIDGAYGGLASSLDNKRNLYEGINFADSVALDFHKWLYQPFEAGCLLVKSWKELKNSYFKKAEYLDNKLEGDNNRLNFNEHHFLLSRSAKSLKVWMSIKFYGIRKIKEMIKKDIDLTDYLNEQIVTSEDFVLKARSHLAVSCFQYKGNLSDASEIMELNQKLIPALEKDGRIFITGTKLRGEFVLRACFINHRKTKMSTDYLLEVIREVGSKIN